MATYDDIDPREDMRTRRRDRTRSLETRGKAGLNTGAAKNLKQIMDAKARRDDALIAGERPRRRRK